MTLYLYFPQPQYANLPEPFDYKRYYAYECANPTCHSFGCQHEPRCKTPHTKPRLLNWTSVPVPVCNKCLMMYRMASAKGLPYKDPNEQRNNRT